MHCSCKAKSFTLKKFSFKKMYNLEHLVCFSLASQSDLQSLMPLSIALAGWANCN